MWFRSTRPPRATAWWDHIVVTEFTSKFFRGGGDDVFDGWRFLMMTLSQIVPLRPQRPSLRQEQGGGCDEAGALLHHRANDQWGGVGRPDLARQLDQRNPGEREVDDHGLLITMSMSRMENCQPSSSRLWWWLTQVWMCWLPGQENYTHRILWNRPDNENIMLQLFRVLMIESKKR